ncbi:MAG: hypothetical protein HY277_03255 [Ignavibacteriales bacterium]|nr:hypothetical protein [Ignavibacteriales bacterium]
MTESAIQQYDKSDMRKLLVDFPKQIEDAVRIGKTAASSLTAREAENIVITGLGGSASCVCRSLSTDIIFCQSS